MKLLHIPIGIALMVSLATSGCTSQQVYNTGKAWQRNECNKIVDNRERERCMSKTNASYEEYKRQTEDARMQQGRGE